MQIKINELTAQTILQTETFDYLFSIEDVAKRNIKLFNLEDRARELKVLTRFQSQYRAEQKEREKLRREADGQSGSYETRMTKFGSDKYPELRCGAWQCDDNGIRIEYDRGVNIASYNPVMPVKRLNNISTKKAKMTIAIKRDGYWSEHILDKSVLLSASRITSAVTDIDLLTSSEQAKQLVKYFVEIEALNQDIIPKQLSTSVMGWATIDGEKYFMPYAKGKLVFDSEDRFEALYRSLTVTEGSMSAYKAFLKKVRQGHRLEPKLALVASVASSIVEMCGALSFILHLYGDGGKGKTLCLMLAASVWGNCNEGGFIADPQSTPTAFEMRLGVLNHLPFICDDMSKVKKKFQSLKGADFSDFIYLVCNGQGSARSNVNLGVNAVPKWKNCSITSSEKTLTQETSQGGEFLRTIEIETERGYIFNDSKGVADFLRVNYGFLGQEFVSVIKDIGKAKLKEIYSGFKKRIEERDVDREKEGKQIESITVLLTADKILTDYILKDGVYLDFDTMYNLIRSNKQTSDNERAYEWLCDKIFEYQKRFEVHSDREPDRRWGYFDKSDEDWVFIIPNVFKELCKEFGVSPQQLIKWLKENNLADVSADRENRIDKQVRGFKEARLTRIKIKGYGMEDANGLIPIDDEDMEDIDDIFPPQHLL